MTAPLPGETAAPPDADFARLFDAALREIQQSAEAWTDHNVHDPGITLLEAALWGLADLHYRTEARRFDAWSSAKGLPDATAPLPRGEVARGIVWHTLSEHEQRARNAITGARSRGEAVALLRREFGVDAYTEELRGALRGVIEPGRDAGLLAALPAPLFREQHGTAAARLLREPSVLAVALDRSADIEAAVEAEQAGEAGVLDAALADAGLWQEEVEDLRRQTSLRLLITRLRSMEPRLREILHDASDVEEAIGLLGMRLDLQPHEADLALRSEPGAPAPPEWWETHTGRSVDWPPHPGQALPVEPVLDGDYRRLALGVHGVRRAWVMPGLARGLRWDGSANRRALPYRQGGLTLLVEPAAEQADLLLRSPDAPLGARSGRRMRFLERCLREALGADGERAEVDAPHQDLSHHIGPLAPRRLIGDEICAAMLATCPVVVGGTLYVEQGVDGRRVLQRAEQLLDRFLSSDRGLEDATPAAEPSCRERLDGPWPWQPESPPGWTPGAPVRVSDLMQALLDVPGLVAVAGLRLQAGEQPEEDGDWETRSLDIDPYCVPRYAGHCFVLAADPGVIDA